MSLISPQDETDETMAPTIVADSEHDLTAYEQAPEPVVTAPPPPAPPARLVSLDAYRGFVMLLMMAEVMRFAKVARDLPAHTMYIYHGWLEGWQYSANAVWNFLGWHQSHVEWIGCSLHDLIQPSFSFIVGVALPFSLAARRAKGQPVWRLTLHAFARALVLIALGIFLRSVGKPLTNFTFEDTLTQIGLGYGFLFLLGLRPVRDQWIAFFALLAGYWVAFALYQTPADFDYAKVGVSKEWLDQYGLSGFATHWNKNSNLAWHFDTWFLNLFPRVKPFEFNAGGYATLSFIPTLATMTLGLIAGETLRSERSSGRKIAWLFLAGAISLGLGWALGLSGFAPIVKRIWTPSWVLFSGGWALLLLAVYYTIIDVAKLRAWAFPLVVVGMNSIAAYSIAHLWESFIRGALITHVPLITHSQWVPAVRLVETFRGLGESYDKLLLGAAILLIEWLVLLWMYRKKIFLRI